jgi:hypothetical protein
MFLLLRQKIANELKKSGYRVISPLRVPLGWIDIGVFGRKNLGIDIFEGNYESCVERLSSRSFSRTFVIGDCEICEQLTLVQDYLGVKFGDCVISCWEKASIKPESIDEVSFRTRAIEDTLAFLYVVGEIYEDKLDEYKFKPLKFVVSDLKRFGFATSHSRPKIGPKYFLSLTSDGVSISKKIITRRVITQEKKLRKLADNPLIYLIAIGISPCLSISKTGFEVEDLNFKSFLKVMNTFPLDLVNYIANPSIRWNFSLNPKLLISHFLVKTALNSDAVALAEKLSRMGLAYKVKVYTPFGDEMCEEYRIARECVEALLKFSYASISEELLSEFMSVSYPLFSKDVHPIIEFCKHHLEKAEKAGVCRITGSKVIIYDNFEKYARVKLSKIMESVLKSF